MEPCVHRRVHLRQHHGTGPRERRCQVPPIDLGTLLIRVSHDWRGNFLPNPPVPGGPFQTYQQLYDAACAHYCPGKRPTHRPRPPPYDHRRLSPLPSSPVSAQRRSDLVAGFRSLSLQDECKEENVAEPASALTLQGPDLSSFNELQDTIKLVEPAIANSLPCSQSVAHHTIQVSPQESGRCLSSSSGSTIFVRVHPDWYLRFYIRIDLEGFFHTYPHLGGPFRSFQEADGAISCHLDNLRSPKMFKKEDKVPAMERIIQKSLYWPDGTKRKCSPAEIYENTRKQTLNLVQALVDKYNEDHNLLGDRAYGLKDVVHFQAFCENRKLYDHFNFVLKTKDGPDNLFFAEVTYMNGGAEFAVSCFCMIEPIDDGRCFGCKNNGTPDMKHPNITKAYTGGHLDGYLPFGDVGEEKHQLLDEDEDEDEETRLRRIYKCFDDPSFVKNLFRKPKYATSTWRDFQDTLK